MKRCLLILICVILILSTVTVLTSCKNTDGGQTSDNAATIDEATEKSLPWEVGGKQPNEYTYKEFEELSAVEQEAFVESFATTEAFREWEKNSGYVESETVAEAQCPWENGGKQPNEYTYEEFEALSGPQQEIFVESFASAEEFEKWENKALSQEESSK